MKEDDIASARTALGTQPGSADATADTPPTAIADRYEVLALLGIGGMGRVYRVHDRSLDEVVALKLLRRELLDLAGVLDRFRQEVKLARRVTHQNVVRTFDFGVHGKDHFLTMEYIEGRSLAQHLDDGLVPLDELLRIARAACAGIAAAHAAGVLHRDLKPDNILIAHSGRVAITDFGIAQATGENRDSQAGTPAYMAPEQVEGRNEIGPSADVYAFGAILFEMLTGSRPFTGKDIAAVMMARLRQPPPDPRQFCAMPDDLAELVLRCLAISPHERLGDGAALAGALAEIDTARMATRVAPAPQAVPAKTSRSVALVPLRATGDLAELADGLSEEIVDALTNTRGLRVRPLSTVRAVASAGDALAIGRALGVDVVVDGSIRRRGDQVRIGARAIGVVDGFQLWSSHVDTSPGGLLSAGDEVARAIARALTVELYELPARRAANPRATALYLEGKAKLRLAWDHGGVEDALAHLEQAHELAPDDPAIVAALAMAVARAAFYGTRDLARAQQLAERAIELAPTSGEAHLALGHVYLYSTRFADAARTLARAVRHAPGLARAQALLGALLLEANSLDDAILHLEGAHAIDPIGPQAADLPRAYFYQGRPDAEIEAIGASVPRNHLGARILRSRFAMWRGQTVSIAPLDFGEVPESQRIYFEIVEKLQRSRSISAEDLAALEGQTYVPNLRLRATRAQFLVEFLVFVDNLPKAIEYLKLSVDSGLQDYCWMLHCPMLAKLRALPEFAALEARVAERARLVTDAVHETIAATALAPV